MEIINKEMTKEIIILEKRDAVARDIGFYNDGLTRHIGSITSGGKKNAREMMNIVVAMHHTLDRNKQVVKMKGSAIVQLIEYLTVNGTYPDNIPMVAYTAIADGIFELRYTDGAFIFPRKNV